MNCLYDIGRTNQGRADNKDCAVLGRECGEVVESLLNEANGSTPLTNRRIHPDSDSRSYYTKFKNFIDGKEKKTGKSVTIINGVTIIRSGSLKNGKDVLR
ncbi:MAG: hypothetical protein IPL26_15880 [Leptospiraceae bacterium]|nr:hypothetical protein [Leptospiraceae bacterium]